MGWRGRGMYGPWPGRGPFSNLPPWQRPGWLYGPGACWRLFGSAPAPAYGAPVSYEPDEQIKDLEAYKREIEAELNELSKELERLKKEAQAKTEE